MSKKRSARSRANRPGKKQKPLTPGGRRLLGLALADLDARRARAAGAAGRADRHREAVRASQATATRAGQDIGPPPSRGNVARWKSCRMDLRRFLETYLSETFYLAWSDDQLKVIARLQETILRGGLFAFAMPRGGGKTSLAEGAALWAILYGHRSFVSLLAVSAERAQDLVEDLKKLLGFRSDPETPLTQDFAPELAPFLALDGEPRKCQGQRCCGKLTGVRWSQRRLIFGAVGGSACPGAIISGSGLTGGGVRGQRIRIGDSKRVRRPDLVLIDDPQDDDIAKSPSMKTSRTKLLNGAVLGMAGPDRKISALAMVTVIQPDDVASRLLDRKKCPDWRGEKMAMLYGKPENPAAWEEYRRCHEEDMHTDGDSAHAFYAVHQVELDAGLRAAWPSRFDAVAGERSAIESAMALKFRDEETFQSEYQNDPVPPEMNRNRLTVDQIAGRASGRPRGEVPIAATILTAFADVHDTLVYWLAVAWQKNFTGYVLDYGTWPVQARTDFRLTDASPTLQEIYKGAGIDGAIQAGLADLVRALLSREWPKAGAAGVARIDRLLVDSGYKPDIVSAVKFSAGGAAMIPSKGVGITAARKPMTAYQRKPGEILGYNWYFPTVKGTREFPHCQFDSNFWKSTVARGWSVAPGDPGALTLFGDRPAAHRLVAEHLSAETAVETFGQGRKLLEWKQKPNTDNHWLDCLVGCAVAASIQGAKPGEMLPGPAGAAATAAAVQGPTSKVQGQQPQQPKRPTARYPFEG